MTDNKNCPQCGKAMPVPSWKRCQACDLAPKATGKRKAHSCLNCGHRIHTKRTKYCTDRCQAKFKSL